MKVDIFKFQTKNIRGNTLQKQGLPNFSHLNLNKQTTVNSKALTKFPLFSLKTRQDKKHFFLISLSHLCSVPDLITSRFCFRLSDIIHINTHSQADTYKNLS